MKKILFFMFSLFMIISTCSASNVFDNGNIPPYPGWTDQTGDVVLTRAFAVGSAGNTGIVVSAVIPNYIPANIIERGFRCVLQSNPNIGDEWTFNDSYNNSKEDSYFGQVLDGYGSGTWVVSAYIITSDEEIHYSETTLVTIP